MALKTFGPVSLKTGCYLISMYTFILALLLAIFNAHDLVYERQYMFPERVVGLVFAACLIFAGVCLFIGTKNGSHSLIATWFIIFLVYVLVQIAAVVWYIVQYTNPNYGVIPASLHSSVLANIIVFSILIILNIFCLYAVRSYKTGRAPTLIL